MEFLAFWGSNVLTTAGRWWWVFLPFYLYPVMFRLWMYHQVSNYFKKNEFSILKLKAPQEMEKSPKLMENVVDGLWAVQGELNNDLEMWVWGNMQDYMSLEIIGSEGKITFGIWLWKPRVDFFKAHFYSQYPDIEIEEVGISDDYMRLVPEDIPNEEWNLFGLIWTLNKPDAYPIRTYPYFQDFVTGLMVDPLAAYMEIMSALGPGEHLWYQLLLEPVADEWYPEFHQELERLLERGKYQEKVPVSEGLKEHFKTLPGETLSAMFKHPSTQEKETAAEEEPSVPFLKLSPAEQSGLKAMEEGFSKRGFVGQYRTIYIARRDVYNSSNHQAMMGAVNQFNSVDSNMFMIYRQYFTSTTYIFNERRLNYKKRRLLRYIKKRQFTGMRHILNTEEVASLWHFPDQAVKSPATPRIPYKKASAPENLPVNQQGGIN